MHLLYFWTSLLAVPAFAPAMLAPGYLLASAIDLCGFRGMRWPEQMLWSVTLSGPLAILLSVYGGLLLGNVGVGALFLLLLAVAVLLRWKTGGAAVPTGWLRSRPVRLLSWIVGGTAAYLLIAAAPLRVRGRLLEGVASADWSVRVPLIGSAIRTGMPLVNPFYAVGGQVGPLRYYMYWYALCGVIGRTFHLPARAVMEAGCVWAAVLLFSTLFLLLKYLFPPAPEWGPMRWATVCVGCCCAMPILGLDILQAVYAQRYAQIVFPEIEWWRAFTGFAPSFHTFLLYAPHHTFGLCAGLTGMLTLLAPSMDPAPASRPRQVVACAIVAGLCFGAMAGTSTYISIFFVLALLLVAADFAWRRDWRMVGAIALAGVFALVGAAYFIRVMVHQSGGGSGAFVAYELRGWTPLIDWFHSQYTQAGKPLPTLFVQWLLLLPLYAALELAEIGVFVVVLVHRLRHDVFCRKAMAAEQRVQWWLALSFALCALFLTSKGTIGTNDLGFHAGFCLRVVAVFWTAPWLVRLWQQPIERRAFLRSWRGGFALALAAIGIATQAWQIAAQRLILLAPGRLHRIDGPFPAPPHLAHQYEQVELAWQAMDRLLPEDAIVLTNPDSVQRSMGLLYVNRQLVAPEPHCMAAFGGNPDRCREELSRLRAVYGETAFGTAQDAAATTAAAIDATCRRNHVSAILVSADDPVWNQPQSWVWRQPPLFANPQERVYPCPAAPR